MLKYISFFLVIALLLLIPAVAADGVAITQDDNDRWNLRPENQQLAAINYENGYENLLLSVTLDDTIRGNHTVWIFPVPAKPEDVSVDVLKGYPRYGGMSLDRKVKDVFVFGSAASAAYATFPASLPIYLMGGAGSFTTQKAEETVHDATGSVVVHEHIEKMGLTTELITAQDSASVKGYIARKGFGLPPNAEGILDGYIGKDYSFVISYVANETEFRTRYQPDGIPIESSDAGLIGVFVRFPTDRIYFPLELTSVYDSRTIPILIYAKGFVSPVLDEKIRPLTEVSYLIDKDYWYSYSSGDLEKFFNYPGDFQPVKYTRIRIAAPSRYFTGDLWMDPAPPIDVRIKDALVTFPPIWIIPLFILVSMLVSLCAGILVFGNNPDYRKHLALHGLWNCATMIGFACGTVEYLKIPGAKARQKLGFFVLFYFLFIALCVIAIAILDPSRITPMVWIGEFLIIVPVIGFMYGLHFFPVSPVLATIAIGANTALYGVAWLMARKYLK